MMTPWGFNIGLFLHVLIHAVIAQQEGDLRLVKGSTPRIGRLEVRRQGEWAPFVDDGRFGEREAMVACRQLGYGTTSAEVFPGGSFGRGSASLRLSRVDCDRGDVNILSDCRYSVCGAGQCSFDLDIGISCEEHDEGYIGQSRSYRRWTGLVVLLIIVPFFGHAYKRRSEQYGYQDRTGLIPIPRYHHGRAPLTGALDDTTTLSVSPPSSLTGSPHQQQFYPAATSAAVCLPGMPVEPMPPVFTNGYVYPPGRGPLPPTAFAGPPNNAPDAAAASATRSPASPPADSSAAVYHSGPAPPYHPPQFLASSYQSAAVSAANMTPVETGLVNPHQLESANADPALNSLRPPEYSEYPDYEPDMTSPTVDEHDRMPPSETNTILGPPPPYEDVVKT